MVLNIGGIDIQGIVAGLGLMSFAIGLALKDVITSMLSSYALLLYKPFSVGDEISVKGITGIVSKMDTRYTTLDSDQETYLLPNAEIISSIIVLKKKFSRDLAQIKAWNDKKPGDFMKQAWIDFLTQNPQIHSFF